MSDEAETSLHDPGPVVTAGALLRDGRVAAGLSIDAVAQQLKLAPRQVQALETDAFALLPGRTFVRGFVRNYARLLRLDIDAVLATLPDAVAAPSLDAPSLAPSPRVMGELPAYLQNKPNPTRWVIAFALLAIVAIVAGYELMRPGSILSRALHGDNGAAPAVAAPTEPSRPTDTAAAPATPLPNPLASAAEKLPSPMPFASPSETASPVASDTAPAARAAGDMPLVLVFTGTSWVEVKDAKGAIVLSTIGYPGAAHTVGGTPPFDVVLGNAEAVAVTYRGVQFDSTPYIKQNVAKFSLK